MKLQLDAENDLLAYWLSATRIFNGEMTRQEIINLYKRDGFIDKVDILYQSLIDFNVVDCLVYTSSTPNWNQGLTRIRTIMNIEFENAHDAMMWKLIWWNSDKV